MDLWYLIPLIMCVALVVLGVSLALTGSLLGRWGNAPRARARYVGYLFVAMALGLGILTGAPMMYAPGVVRRTIIGVGGCLFLVADALFVAVMLRAVGKRRAGGVDPSYPESVGGHDNGRPDER